jgi:acylphosphatase
MINMPRTFLVVHGHVQGVGYRALVREVAHLNNIAGFVRNAPDGSVEILAEARTPIALDNFIRGIQTDPQKRAQISKIEANRERLKKYNDRKYHGFLASFDEG